MRQDLARRVEAALAEIRPSLRMEGMDVELVDVDERGTARLAVRSLDLACPVDMSTLRFDLRQRLRERVPEVTSIRAVTEGSDEEYEL